MRPKSKRHNTKHRLPNGVLWLCGLAVMALYVWAFYYFFVSPFGFRWRAIYGEKRYPDGYEIRGIDISHHQGDIDWQLLANAQIEQCPLRFILIKATEGASRTDPKFADNFANAYRYGYIRGAYHYWSNRSTPQAQARHYIANVKLEKGDLPPVLDVEQKPKDMPLATFQRSVLAWLHLVEQEYGVKPIIYTYHKFKAEYLNTPDFDLYPYWIAHYYVDELQYNGKWKFWQHTDAGQLPGIKGYVDFDLYNGSFYDLQRLTIP